MRLLLLLSNACTSMISVGHYQFRFLSSVGAQAVWRDLLYDEDCIPHSSSNSNEGGVITIKANRLQSAAPNASNAATRRPEALNHHNSHNNNSHSQPVNTSTTKASSAVGSVPKPQRSERLISFDDSDPTLAGSGRRPQPQMMGADNGNGSNNNSNTDLLGFDAVMSSNNKVMSLSSFYPRLLPLLPHNHLLYFLLPVVVLLYICSPIQTLRQIYSASSPPAQCLPRSLQ